MQGERDDVGLLMERFQRICPRLKGAVAISILKESVGNLYSSRTMLFPDSQAWELAAFTYAPVGGLSRLCR